jgi:hypothetical protein
MSRMPRLALVLSRALWSIHSYARMHLRLILYLALCAAATTGVGACVADLGAQRDGAPSTNDGRNDGQSSAGGAPGLGGRAGANGGGGAGGGIVTATGGTSGGSGGVAGINGGSGGRGGSGSGGSGSGGSGMGGRGGSGSGGSGSGGSGMGGRGTGGSGSGGSGTGGAPATSCNIGPANNGSGSFTEYWFTQCTGCNQNPYTTACGYQGSSSGMSSDRVTNIPTPGYFAAIPGNSSSDFNSSKYCGACAQVSNGGNSVIVTIVDECPADQTINKPCRDNPNGHLDLSVPAFTALGFPSGNPTGTTWKFVPCPVTGNVILRIKTGNPNELFIENEITPIASVSMGGTQANRQSYGAWHFNGNIPAGATLTLTDIAGRTITVQVNSLTANQNQDTGKQFPKCQ